MSTVAPLAARASTAPRLVLRACGLLAAAALAACGDVTGPRPSAREAAPPRHSATVTPDSSRAPGDSTATPQQGDKGIWW
jgi:hypothetical protein